MKRILVFVLALILGVTSLAVPSYASENDSGWIEVLDYDSVNSSGNFFTFDGNTTINFTLPGTSQLYYIDMVYTNTGSVADNILSLWNGNIHFLTIVPIGNNMFRAYGSLPVYNYAEVSLMFGSPGTSYITIHSCRVSQIPLSPFYQSVTGFLTAGGSWVDLSYLGGGEPVKASISTGSSSTWSYSSGFRFPDWKKYDYIDLSLSLYGVASINSVVARLESADGDPGGSYIDVSTSYIANSFYNDGNYEVVIHLDVSQLDKTSDKILVLLIDGEHSGETLDLYINECRGFVIANVIDSTDHWLIKIFNSVSSGFNSVITWFQNTYNAMVSGFDQLIDILSGSGDSQGFDDDVGQQGNKLDDMEQVMDSVTKPAIDSIDTDLSGIVSDADLTNVAQVYTFVIGDSFMPQIMTMVVVMAMMSFVLFGKR